MPQDFILDSPLGENPSRKLSNDCTKRNWFLRRTIMRVLFSDNRIVIFDLYPTLLLFLINKTIYLYVFQTRVSIFLVPLNGLTKKTLPTSLRIVKRRYPRLTKRSMNFKTRYSLLLAWSRSCKLRNSFGLESIHLDRKQKRIIVKPAVEKIRATRIERDRCCSLNYSPSPWLFLVFGEPPVMMYQQWPLRELQS